MTEKSMYRTASGTFIRTTQSPYGTSQTERTVFDEEDGPRIHQTWREALNEEKAFPCTHESGCDENPKYLLRTEITDENLKPIKTVSTDVEACEKHLSPIVQREFDAAQRKIGRGSSNVIPFRPRESSKMTNELSRTTASRKTAGDTHVPPQGVQDAAKRALDWISDGKAGDGFTGAGRNRAKTLAAGEGVSSETIGRMVNFFSRHEVDKKATGFNSGEEGHPSPGRVAWDAWGGDAGKSWAEKVHKQIKSESKEASFDYGNPEINKWASDMLAILDAEARNNN